jgi:hypothetical protein
MMDVAAKPTDAHQALSVAARAIALADRDTKLQAVECEALRLAPLVNGGEITRGQIGRAAARHYYLEPITGDRAHGASSKPA